MIIFQNLVRLTNSLFIYLFIYLFISYFWLNNWYEKIRTTVNGCLWTWKIDNVEIKDISQMLLKVVCLVNLI